MTAQVDATAEREHARRHAQRGAFLGFFVDMFDIYLPIIVLAPAIEYFISPDLSASAAALVTGMIFAATLVGRPLGALLFGRYADTRGRKRATVVAVSGFGILTVMVGLLPGYEAWGITSVVAFVVLRFVIGVFVGGEYTAASPLAMEYSPQEKRGINGGLIMTGFPLAYVAVALITLVMLQVAPADGLGSPYVQWGWRIPFFIGGLLALGFVVYYLRSVRESELFQASGGGNPVKDLFSGENRRNFFQVFILMTGFWLSLNCVTAILPGLMTSELGMSGTQITITLVIAYLCTTVGYIVAANLSQRIGRRPFLIVWGGVAGGIGTAVYAILLVDHPGEHGRHHRAGDRAGPAGDLELGPGHGLHQREVPHRRARNRLRAGLQPGGRHPVVLRVLPGLAVCLHAVRVDRATAAGHRRRADHRRRCDGSGDQGRGLRGGRPRRSHRRMTADPRNAGGTTQPPRRDMLTP